MTHMKATFVGERRSPTAERMDVRWEDGRLAAKQLFDAIVACGHSPQAFAYMNLFERGAIKRLAVGGTLIAMGRKVQAELTRRGIAFVPLVHPAARGAIRRKDRYIAEVRTALDAAGYAVTTYPGVPSVRQPTPGGHSAAFRRSK